MGFAGHFKLVARRWVKDRQFSAINLVGLVVGMSTFLIISHYVRFERSYDDFHENPEEIYRIATIRYSQGKVFSESTAAMPALGPLLIERLPDIQTATRIYLDGNSTVSFDHPSGKRVFNEEKGYYADAHFFEVFGFPVLYGNPAEALNDPGEIAISKSTALKYFGKENPVGEILNVTSYVSTDYRVSAVFEDPPQNSHFKPALLFSYRTFIDVIRPGWGVEQNLLYNGFRTYAISKLSAEALTDKVQRTAHEAWQERFDAMDIDYDFYAQPIQSIHTKSHIEKEFEANNDERLLNALMIIAVIILVTSWVNYFNLSLSKSVERTKEVGVRKSLGATSFNVKVQLLLEALWLHALAAIISVVLFFVLQKWFLDTLDIYYPKEINAAWLMNILLLTVGGTLVSYYPGSFLSKLRIHEILKGRLRTSPKGQFLIKGLLLFQLVMVPLLMASVYLVQKQTQHLVNQDLGIDTEQVLAVKGPRISSELGTVKFDRFKLALEQRESVQSLSLTSLLPGENATWASWFRIYGDSAGAQYMKSSVAEYDFEKVLNLDIVAGRSFDRSFQDSTSLIINESAARLWGYSPEEIIGKKFFWRFSRVTNYDRRVIGVVKDYQQDINSREAMPIAYGLNRFCPNDYREKFFLIKLNGNAEVIASTLKGIEQQWLETYPNDPFNYEFLDDTFHQAFHKEQQTLRLVRVFGIVSFVLAGLGLFGLSSLIAVQRTKEMGIRKVLGASSGKVLQLISQDFVLLSLLAYAITIPVKVMLANTWLSNYEIRIGLDTLFFALPLVTTFVIVSISTLGNSLSVARKNPVDALRYE